MGAPRWQAEFDAVQTHLPTALAANRPGSGVDHVLIAMPSYSVGESLLSHYADRIPSLEHRYLLGSLLVGRLETCEVVFVTCESPGREVLAYYASLLPEDRRETSWARVRMLTVPDASARPVAAKLLDHPDLLDELRRSIGTRPALIEAWNVSDAEVAVACRLRVPINGSSPALRGIAFKSEGRRILQEAGVPVPFGCEDVRDLDSVVEAIATIRNARPGVSAVVIKLDDSGAGDGNIVVNLLAPDAYGDALRRRLLGMPDWYLTDLRKGAVVEELVTGEWCASPSAQIDIEPSGRTVVLATHEQVLGGDNGQVYTGCRFPADSAYAGEIATHAASVGELLARRGAVGRVSVDFIVAREATGRWSVRALEVNLRKGGTTHPYTALRCLVPGRYDSERGIWIAADGSNRAYVSTDNAVDPNWRSLQTGVVIDAVGGAGVRFNAATGTGVVLHMLSGLRIDGRFGLTAIGRSAEHAHDLYERALAAVAAAAQGYNAPGGA